MALPGQLVQETRETAPRELFVQPSMHEPSLWLVVWMKE